MSKIDRNFAAALALLSLALAGSLLAGCASSPTPTGAVAPQPIDTDTPQPIAAATPVLPTLPPTAMSGPSFRDDFDGALAAGWQWINEDPSHWNLTDTPGHLRIMVQPSNINDGRIRNFLVREAPQGNFEIATLLRFAPSQFAQFAGLLVYQEQGDAMQFGRSFAQCPTGCVGNGIYFDSYQAGNMDPSNFATKVENDGVAYLRLRREGDTYAAHYSGDGVGWTEIGRHQSTITPKYVGLVGVQGYAAEAPADFDYFTLEVLQ